MLSLKLFPTLRFNNILTIKSITGRIIKRLVSLQPIGTNNVLQLVKELLYRGKLKLSVLKQSHIPTKEILTGRSKHADGLELDDALQKETIRQEFYS